MYYKTGPSGKAYVSVGGGFYVNSPWFKTDKSIFKSFGVSSKNNRLNGSPNSYRKYIRLLRKTKILFSGSVPIWILRIKLKVYARITAGTHISANIAALKGHAKPAFTATLVADGYIGILIARAGAKITGTLATG